MLYQEYNYGEYLLSTNKSKIDRKLVHQFLSENSYWAENIPFEIVNRSIDHSFCFGMYCRGNQIGFARLITDFATFAYLADVFIMPEHRGKGLSKWMMEIIMNHESLQGLRRFLLATRDAHGLYEQFGFKQMENNGRWMNIHNPDVYKNN